MICEYYAKKYCCEDLSLIENYDKAIADTTQTWECHHILGEQYSKKYLKENGLYENRPACEFRFMTKLDHNRLHTKGVPKPYLKGIPLSEEHKKAIGEAQRGIPKGPMSEATKKAISETLKGVPKPYLKGVPKSEEHKKAIGEANSKKILQFTKSGEFIREWSSMSETYRQLKIKCSNICSCCKGKCKSAGGYIWKYK